MTNEKLEQMAFDIYKTVKSAPYPDENSPAAEALILERIKLVLIDLESQTFRDAMFQTIKAIGKQ